MAATSWSNSTVNNETPSNTATASASSSSLQLQQQQPPTSLLEESTDNIIVAAAVAVAAVSAAATAVLMLDNVKESDNPTTTEIQLLSPPSPNDTTTASQETQLFAEKLQMKLKSHLLESEVVSANDQDDYYNLTHEDDESNNTNTINPGGSATEVFYDFDDIVLYTNGSDELTSDYGTGCSNSTVVPDSCGSSVVGVVDVKLEDLSLRDGDGDDDTGIEETRSLPKYQRSSSLKTGKTPPGTPMKKIVRFADAMGLDLIDIKVFMDEVPRVPKEAYRDLHIPDFNSTNTSLSSSSPFDFYKPFSYSKTSSGGNATASAPNNLSNFVPLFHQPITLPDFFDKIRDQKVLLENAYLTQETVTKELIATSRQVIKGTVRVINLDFHKSVYVRYTYNDWKEFYDFQATYITDSCDGYTDRFEFKIEIDESKLPAPYLPDHDDAKITFACRFHCQGTQFWDNNQERNYVFQNVPVVKSSGSGKGGSSSVFVASNSRYSSFDDDYEWYNNRSGGSKAVDKSKLDELLGSSGKGNPVAAAAIITPTTPKTPAIQRKPKETTPPLVLPSLNYSIPPPQPTYPDTTTNNKMLDLNDCGFESKILSSNLITGVTGANNNSCNHGGGSHLSSSLYTPSSFYESAYACPYSNNFGSACFY